MSKNIRKRFLRALRSTFRPEKTFCCTTKKPDNYEFVTYQPKQTPSNSDYVELSECHSWSMSNSNNQLQSTKIYADDSISIKSDLSSIRNSSSIQCCRCQCHHSTSNHMQSFVPIDQFNGRKIKVYPFIF